ncbi:MAG TPA: hypothetical protein DDW95_02935, partial [Alphaproteobacteria bacterium]|nr:hypothetical protein [Alphaproteobacteria bacterium]
VQLVDMNIFCLRPIFARLFDSRSVGFYLGPTQSIASMPQASMYQHNMKCASGKPAMVAACPWRKTHWHGRFYREIVTCQLPSGDA